MKAQGKTNDSVNGEGGGADDGKFCPVSVPTDYVALYGRKAKTIW